MRERAIVQCKRLKVMRSNAFPKKLVIDYPLTFLLALYVTIAFQICFPFLVSNKRFRPYFFLVGCLVHVGIALAMGLFFFGTIMTAAYELFIEEESAEKFMKMFQKIFNYSGIKTAAYG